MLRHPVGDLDGSRVVAATIFGDLQAFKLFRLTDQARFLHVFAARTVEIMNNLPRVKCVVPSWGLVVGKHRQKKVEKKQTLC